MIIIIYFANERIGLQNSGIEYAEFDRAKLFRNHHVDFKFITIDYNPVYHAILPKFGISDTEFVNMYDYFQNTLSVVKQEIKPVTIDFGIDVELVEDSTGLFYTAMVDKYKMGKIIVDVNGNVQSVDYYDNYQHLYKRVKYDVRGFASLYQWYDAGKITTEEWLNSKGKVCIQKFNYYNRENEIYSTWKINNLIFNSISDVRKFFYEQLNKNDIFIIDRGSICEEELSTLSSAKLIYVIHSHHMGSANNPNELLYNNNYEWMLNNLNNWDYVIASTNKQVYDLQQRFPEYKDKFISIPVGYNSSLKPNKVSMSQRKQNSILITARVAPEKNIDKIIKAVSIAQKTIPDITLDIYGYIDSRNDNLAKKRIDKVLPEVNNVIFHGYSENLNSIRDNHQLYIVFSDMEGFNLALLEAQNHGIVGLTNNVEYGPTELICDTKNGYIVGYQDVNKLADKIVYLFQNKHILQELSDNAYQLSGRYSEENVWEHWKTLFKKLK